MPSDLISATKTFVMRIEENFWNVSVCQRLHVLNIVLTYQLIKFKKGRDMAHCFNYLPP
jgi:hypothetical protein